ncbi:MAG TPA: TM0106 family RecB-like putative nuclease [Defluviitoga sp.]|nr:TM0106 family RecB-like putative nuclease [Defluviitoga sp.]HOP23864.1 TM0106 family RecB-like putative nuclease [Defluviitoga sp.]HPZ28389.1 TM0106 family RecB-like putative nuclease [Defluviitoga sp.]HQD62487.1 TM0106 family RecB-like putative nuclease [Defluviitoga sp.]
MDLLYYENFKNCGYFVPTYKRQGIYFNVNIEEIDVQANYESINDDVVKISRLGNNFKKTYWLHIYAVYRYFEEKNIPIKRIVLETSNASYEVTPSDIILREKWIKKDFNNLKKASKSHGSHCKFCKIKKACHLEFLEEGDLSVVPNFSQNLIKELKSMELDPVLIVKTNQIEKMDRKFRKPLYNLKSLLEDKIISLEKFDFPEDYIVFDVESYMRKDFLFGFLENDKYIPFFLGNNEAKVVKVMISYLSSKNKTLLHYDKSDIIALEKIGNRYPEFRKKINKIIANSLDLYEVISKNYTLPVVSYSLKDISKYFGYQWNTELNGFAVILEYRLYLKGDKESLERIFKYNEEDCRATKWIVDQLVSLNK